MAQKGVTRTGEAYCLSCYEVVDRGADRCPSCGSELSEEVRAFQCPKCQTVVVLGSLQCPNCSLKFKVKALRPSEPAGDERLLMKLIDWGKAPPEEKSSAEVPSVPSGSSVPEKVRDLRELRTSIMELMENRSQMLERMQKRLDEQKVRLALIGSETDGAATDEAEEEIMALASEMADITMLQAHMDALSEEISKLMESVDVSDAAKERGLAAKALRAKLDEKEHELEELKTKEELLVRREEMVDRKIQGYAEKKKELDLAEEDLKLRLTKLEAERAELERLKAAAAMSGDSVEHSEAIARWQEEQKRVHERLAGIHLRLAGSNGAPEGMDASAEADLEKTMSGIEQKIAALVVEKSELQAKIGEARAMDEDMKKLLIVLDQMLGQLPSETIEAFSKTGDFALYERMLDKFKI